MREIINYETARITMVLRLLRQKNAPMQGDFDRKANPLGYSRSNEEIICKNYEFTVLLRLCCNKKRFPVGDFDRKANPLVVVALSEEIMCKHHEFTMVWRFCN